MKPSEALTVHRDELRQLVSRYSVVYPRVYGSALTGKDDEESDLDLLVDPRNVRLCLPSLAWSMKPNNC
jgi:hypothetical protein